MREAGFYCVLSELVQDIFILKILLNEQQK